MANRVQVKFTLPEDKSKRFNEILNKEYLTKQGILEKAVDRFLEQYEKEQKKK